MYHFVLGIAAAGLALAAPALAEAPKGPDGKCLDGAWTVVCYEKGGEPQADARGMAVKAEAGTITCAGKDGRAGMSLKVTLGQGGAVQVTEGDADTAAAGAGARAGVYVLTADYLAISVNADAAAGDKAAAGANNPRCSLILKRDAAK